MFAALELKTIRVTYIKNHWDRRLTRIRTQAGLILALCG